MALFNVVVALIVIVVMALCARRTVGASKPWQSRSHVVQAATLGALAGLAPLAAVIFLRLSIKACAVANFLGLPWAEPWREVAHWLAGLIWLASTLFIFAALTMPRLRSAGVAMVKWSIVIAVPTFFIYCLLIFGDPGPNCVPV